MRRGCQRHGSQPGPGPCSCGLGRMPRLVEPVILSLLSRGETRYGYEIMEQANQQALTDSTIDAAVIYRTLRMLERNGCVVSEWQPGAGGPHRRMYEITDLGREHLQNWLTVLQRLFVNLQAFVAAYSTE